MSLLNWFSPKPSAQPETMVDSSTADADRLRDERIDRRERLYAVVRTSLVQAGVATASFKFKVLALDDQGQQFLVMVDVALPWGGDPGWRAGIEERIIQTAQTEHNLVITSVYWRNNPELVVAIPASTSATLPEPEVAPLEPVTQAGGVGRYEPLHDDEIVAFQQALEAASRLPSVAGKIH